MHGDPREPSYVVRVPNSLCRLAIRPLALVGTEDAQSVDLTLPADSPVAVLIPPIADVVLAGSVSATHPLRLCLTRVGGLRLDTSKTLRENDVHDGDLILLTTAPGPAPRRRRGESSGAVAELADQPASGALPGAVSAAGTAAAMAGAVALAWTGATAGTAAHLWTAGTLSAAGATGAVVVGRSARRLPLALSLVAVAFAMVTGFLAIPDASWAPTFLLSAAPGFAVSILLLQMICDDTAVLHAVAAAAGATAVTGLIGLTTDLPFEAAGAVLTVLSLVALSAAPKMTVTVAGLGPMRPEVGNRRAGFGHRVLTGLVAGWSFSTALGVVAVAAVAVSDTVPSPVAALFAADIGLLLVLRQRTHIDVRRRVALGAAGLCAVAAACLVAVTAEPQYASWICAATVVAGLAAVARQGSTAALNPVARQLFQAVEFLALAAVVPLAAWVTGVYSLARGLSLG